MFFNLDILEKNGTIEFKGKKYQVHQFNMKEFIEYYQFENDSKNNEISCAYKLIEMSVYSEIKIFNIRIKYRKLNTNKLNMDQLNRVKSILEKFVFGEDFRKKLERGDVKN